MSVVKGYAPPCFMSTYKRKVRSQDLEMAVVEPALPEVENVIENESHLIAEIVDDDLSSLAMLTKHFLRWQWRQWKFHSWNGGGKVGSMGGMGGGSFSIRSMESNDGRGGGGFVVVGGRSSKELRNACGEVRGVENKSSKGSKLMASGEVCLDGCVRAEGGEVNGGGDVLGVSNNLLGEVLGEIIGESGEVVV
nr:hypothetical protein [Tanacetum cinerariifolium]